MTSFDPTSLLQAQTDGSMETEYSPIPEGEYQGVIINEAPNEIGLRQFTSDEGKVRYYLDVPLRIDAPGNDLADGRVARYSCPLDLSEGGGFERGPNKNVKLGQLRSAVRQNDPGKIWKIADLDGQPLRLTIQHSAPNDEGRVFANVKMVAPL